MTADGVHPTSAELARWQLRGLGAEASLPITEHLLGCAGCLRRKTGALGEARGAGLTIHIPRR